MQVNALLLDPFFTNDLPQAILERTGNLRLGFTTNSGRFRSILTTDPVTSLADMSGRKIRVAEIELHVELMKALGAVPVVVPWTETYSALSTGVVNGLNAGVMNLIEAKMADVVKHAYLDQHVHLFAFFFLSNQWYQDLPRDLQSVVDEAMQYASVVSRGYNLQREADADQQFLAMGGTITVPSEDQKLEFVEAASSLRDWYIERYGDEWLLNFEAALIRANATLPASHRN
jgi:TRAP-type C4-dicarboxylate transport system substrate-binding protein